MYKHTQRSFAGGFLDASLMGRQDLAKYFTGSSRLDNFRVRRQGCISKRSGTDFVADLSKLTQKFNSTNYRTFAGMRLFPLVQDASGGYYLLFVTYTLDQTESYTDSSGDTANRTRETRIYVAGPKGVLLATNRRSGGNNWTRTPTAWVSDNDTAYYVDADFVNFTASGVGEIDLYQSGDTVFAAHRNRPPRAYTWDRSALTIAVTKMSFSHSATAAPSNLTTASLINFEVHDAKIESSSGSAPLMTKTQITWDTTGGNGGQGKKTTLAKAWAWGTGGWTRVGIDDPAVQTVPISTVSYVATAVKDGLESNPSAVKSVTYCLPWPQGGKVTLTATVATGSNAPDRVNFYKKQSSGYGFIGYAEPSSGTATFVDDYITPDMSVTPPYNDEDPFAGSGNYPSCVGTYQQRLVFASSRNKPMGFWMSAIGDIYNFSPRESYREDDMIAAELAAIEMPTVNHIVVNRDLLMFADAAEWRIAPVSGNALTYKTVSAKMQSQIGCAKSLKPMAIADEVVFSERTKRTLRAIGYSYSSDGYESQDLSVLSQDYFDTANITSMCYRQHPDSEIVCCMSDGTLRILAYMREHEVVAWSRHVLGGGWNAKAVASNKSVSYGATDVMIVVQQSAEGRTGEWELWRMRTDSPDHDVKKRVCMDGVREYKVINFLREANGNVLPLFTNAVAAGGVFVEANTGLEVTHARLTERTGSGGPFVIKDNDTVILGYPFEARWASVRPEPQGGGNIQFEVKNAKDMEVRVLDGGAWQAAHYGGIDAAATYIPQKVDPGVSVVDGRVTLDTADHTVLLSGANSGDGRVEIRSTDVWPLTILSVSTNYEIHPVSDSEG